MQIQMHINYNMNLTHFSILGKAKTPKHQKHILNQIQVQFGSGWLDWGHLRSTGCKTSRNASVDMHDED